MHFVSESHKSSKPFGSHYYRSLIFPNAVEHCIHCFQSNYFKEQGLSAVEAKKLFN